MDEENALFKSVKTITVFEIDEAVLGKTGVTIKKMVRRFRKYPVFANKKIRVRGNKIFVEE